MKRNDFKIITKKHIETIKKLINSNGKCEDVECRDCPFCSDNSIFPINCCADLYGKKGIEGREYDEKLLQSAKEFLKMCGYEETTDIKKETIVDENVNSPKHYKLPGLNIESIDIIRAILGKYFKWFCLGNVIKYVLRAEKKNGLEDYKKARKYLNWLIEREER